MRRLGIFFVVLVLLGVAIWFLGMREGQQSSVPLFETRAWLTDNPAPLYIRDLGDGVLLLTRVALSLSLPAEDEERAVYRYDDNAKTLEQVPYDLWETSSARAFECSTFPTRKKSAPINVILWENTLHFNDREMSFAAPTVLSYAESPSGLKIAVLSASGERGSIFPFLGGGQNASGQHYHQTFSLIDGSEIGAPIKLPFTTERQAFSNCWSHDERFVFYESVLDGELAIVKIQP